MNFYSENRFYLTKKTCLVSYQKEQLAESTVGEKMRSRTTEKWWLFSAFKSILNKLGKKGLFSGFFGHQKVRGLGLGKELIFLIM